MDTIQAENATIVAGQVLPSPWVTTEGEMRKRVRALIKVGVTQKAIAAEMSVSEGWLSHWLKEDPGYRARVEHMDLFYRFADKVAAVARGENPKARAV